MSDDTQKQDTQEADSGPEKIEVVVSGQDVDVQTPKPIRVATADDEDAAPSSEDIAPPPEATKSIEVLESADVSEQTHTATETKIDVAHAPKEPGDASDDHGAVHEESAATPVSTAVPINVLAPPPVADASSASTATDVPAEKPAEPTHAEPELPPVAEPAAEEPIHPGESDEPVELHAEEAPRQPAEELAAPPAQPPAPAPESASSEENLAPVAKAPVEDVVAAPPEEKSAASSAVSSASGAAAMATGISASQVAKNKGKHPHRNNRKFAVVMTLLFGLLLAGIAVYVYTSTASNTQKTNTTVNNANLDASNETQPAVTPATTDDLDTTTTEIDAALETLDDTTDLSEDDLSDESLGL